MPEENDDQNDSEITLKRSQIRAMERDAKLTREATERASAAERKLAIIEAGLDMTNPTVAFFARHYDGELTADAVRQAASEAGILVDPVGGSPSGNEGEGEGPTVDSTNARDLIANGAIGDTGKPPERPVRITAIETAREYMNQGATREEAGALAFNQLVAAAAKGDKSVIIPSIGQTA